MSSPVQVGTATDWTEITGWPMGGAAVDSDGKLFTWGSNSRTALGRGGGSFSGADRQSPVQVGSLTDWSNVGCAKDGGFLAVKTDGTLWGWGDNRDGHLGLGDTTDRNSPVQVGSLTDWKMVTGSYLGNVCAIKTDGTLWSWGFNTNGAVGNSSVLHVSSPVQVGSLTTWSTVSQSNRSNHALKTDGTIWFWGKDQGGSSGLNSYGIARSSPVQIGSLTNWVGFFGSANNSMMVNSSDELWITGNDDNGQCGTGATSGGNNSPVQAVGTGWYTATALMKMASAAQNTQIAIKVDGTLWQWGRGAGNNSGLGGGNTDNSAPTQLGSLSTWVNISSTQNAQSLWAIKEPS